MEQAIEQLDTIIETLELSDVMDDFPDFTNADVLALTILYHRCEQFIAGYDRIKKQNGFNNLI